VGKHLWKSCEHYGPLIVHSSFPFESFYGDLLKTKQGTHYYQKQMLYATGYYNCIKVLTSNTIINNSTQIGKFLEKMNIPVNSVQLK